jgi:hypothetical protein
MCLGIVCDAQDNPIMWMPIREIFGTIKKITDQVHMSRMPRQPILFVTALTTALQ